MSRAHVASEPPSGDPFEERHGPGEPGPAVAGPAGTLGGAAGTGHAPEEPDDEYEPL